MDFDGDLNFFSKYTKKKHKKSVLTEGRKCNNFAVGNSTTK